MASEDVSASATAQKRYDRQAGFYDLMEAPWEILIYRGLRRRLWAGVRGATLLEVGVGTGRNLPYHPGGTRVVAVDLSPRMLRRAAARARGRGGEIDFVLADAQPTSTATRSRTSPRPGWRSSRLRRAPSVS
jgi:ubiquinone/menaquinone biosynthesis C-methylase UbiE